MTAAEPGGPATLDLGLSGRRVLVTGGWRGIGRACVEGFLRHGANVSFTYVPEHEPVGDIAALVASWPGRLAAHELDLRSAMSIASAMRQAAAQWGSIDVLVNNAAVGSATVAQFSADADAQDAIMLQVNAAGTLAMCRRFLELPADGGASRSIVNISSVGGGVTQFPGFRLSDGMSKAAVAHLTRQLAAEQVHGAVNVFALCPGATNTAMLQASTLDKMSSGERDEFLARLPRGRLIEPAEIAAIALFLSSPWAAPMHGAVIDASMGLGVRPGLMTEFGH